MKRGPFVVRSVTIFKYFTLNNLLILYVHPIAGIQALRNLIKRLNFATSVFLVWTMVNLRSRTLTIQHMLIGHTHSKRFFYNSEECVSLNIECRYF